MIVVKTRMKKVPKTCKTCVYKRVVEGDRCCVALADNMVIPGLNMIKSKNNYYYPPRPKWCPLVEIEKDKFLM